ncbi:MAG: RNA polymerase sigma factor [Psychrilyobacter sp.]|uniref:RNA polymerase sigma factor n=1 Tax=Psychrilyobacter sp. TaxID=2586924 RepID=UPI003C72BAEB
MNFDEIFETYFSRIYNKILGMVKNKEDAEDIAQDVFLTVYKNLKKFRNESGIYTWVYRIAINKTYDFFRRKKETFELNEEVLSIEDNEDVTTKIVLEEKLRLISEREREIILMKDIYGYKLREIGKIKDMKLSTVKSVYYKGLKEMGGL